MNTTFSFNWFIQPGVILFEQNHRIIGAITNIEVPGMEKHGSKTFYKLLEEMSDIHSKKSHDYASNEDPYGNYKFAGMLSQLFKNSDDAGFVGRVGEKLYRLANLENNNIIAMNENIEDTERDIATIIALWVAFRRDRRWKNVE